MLDFLYIAVSWVLLRWHDLFVLIGFSQSSGWGWALSIIFLVITARLLLFRLFIKQMHYTRNMQRLQPKIQKLREKYKDDRAALNREMMALQQEEGFNPLSGCLPIALQFPVFIGLFHTLRHLSNSVKLCAGGAPRTNLSDKAQDLLSSYTFSQSETCHAASASILKAPLAANFRDSVGSGSKVVDLGGSPGPTLIVLVVLLIISAGATFATQLLVKRNNTAPPAEGTAATVQRLMLYVVPLGVLGSGLLFNFPLGVLLYWFTSNIWTLGQQAYVIRFHPNTPEAAAPVGELGRTLAPKPGAKPVRPSGPAGGSSTVTLDKGPNADRPSTKVPGSRGANGSSSSEVPASAAAGSAPRPGARPARSNGKRPPAKRPTKAKKRR